MPTLVTDDPAAAGELPHTLEVDRGLAIRLYLWTYAASTRRINTCKLFWAFVFMPIALPISAAIHALIAVLEWADDKLPSKPAKPYVPPPPGPSKGEKFIESVSGFMARIWFRLQPILKWGGIAIGAAAALILLYLAVTNLTAVVVGILWLLAALAFIAVIAAVVVGAITVLDKSRKVHGFFRMMGQLGRTVHQHTCANVRVK